MEESSEQRKRRLRALREEAQEQGQGQDHDQDRQDEEGTAFLPSPGRTLSSSVPDEPTTRFDFYTDPLAAFNSSQKKTKVKGSPSSPYPRSRPPPTLLGSSSVSPGQQQRLPSPSLHLQEEDQKGLQKKVQYQRWEHQHDYHLQTQAQHQHQYSQQGQQKQGNFLGMQNPRHGVYSSGGGNGIFRPIPPPPGCSSSLLPEPSPRGVSAHDPMQGFRSPQPNTRMSQASSVLGYEPRIGFGSPQPSGVSGFEPRAGLGSPQPLGVPRYEPMTSLGGEHPPTVPVNECRPGFGSPLTSPSTPAASATAFAPQSSGSYEPGEGKYWGRGASHGRGRGSSSGPRANWNSGGRGSPGGYRNNRSAEKFGNRGFQKSFELSARDCPHLFYKKSMVIDPWKDLVPVRLDMIALIAEDQSARNGRGGEWLPKSISNNLQESPVAQFSVSPMGPSLAESLAASFADAVGGEAD